MWKMESGQIQIENKVEMRDLLGSWVLVMQHCCRHGQEK